VFNPGTGCNPTQGRNAVVVSAWSAPASGLAGANQVVPRPPSFTRWPGAR
jgi:hypothetical protein